MDHFANCLAEATKKTPEKIAIVNAGQSLTYRKLSDLVDDLAGQLVSAGMREADYVLLPIGNSLLFVVAFFAVLRNNAIVFKIAPDSTEEEVNIALDQFNPDFALFDGNITLPAKQKIASSVGKLFSIGLSDALCNLTPISENYGIFHHDNDYESRLGKGYIYRIMSSGSSGRKKHIHRDIVGADYMIQAFSLAYSLTANDVFLNFAPAHNNLCLCMLILASGLGGTIILEAKFWPNLAINDIKNYKVTWLAASPFVFDLLSKSVVKGRHDFSSLRRAVSVGSPLTENIYDQVRANCGLGLHELYGSSEATLTAAKIDNGIFEQGVVGTPVPGTIVKIFDDDFNELPVGEIGNIGTISPATVKSYVNDNAKFNRCFHDSFVFVGDRGFMGEDGRLHLAGRSNLIINVAGGKVDVTEVEEIINLHPNIVESAVYGISNNNTEMVVAAAITKSLISQEDLMKWCRNRLPAHKVPKKIIFLDALPRDSVGKLMRSKLAGLF